MIERTLVGGVVAAVVAAPALRARWLSPSGAVAALAVGTISVAAGWKWGELLLAFFISTSILSRTGAARKARLTGGVVAKGGSRDAAQVVANGGVFAVGAILSLAAPATVWWAVGAGALAAAAADSWGTEVGTLVAGREARLITTGRRVPAGTSGGVTAAGLLATLAGASFIAAVAFLLGWPRPAALAAVIGGMAGAFSDSLAGALWQARRTCPRCGTGTERLVHDCGTPTNTAGGVRWLDNDAVNALCTVVGAVVAALVARG